jgi:D-sedoheptulose 7-phosphate isomerase
MLTSNYIEHFNRFFNDPHLHKQIEEAVQMIRPMKRIFFLGNGGSNSICSHMMEDYGKMGRFKTFSFSDAALITCYANDYGYEQAMAEYLKLHFEPGDMLIAISSSGNSKNITNAVQVAKDQGGKVITLSGFKPDNRLKQMGDLNFFLESNSYGIVECYHQVILHIVLDMLCA